MSGFDYWVTAVATDQSAGNQLAALVGAEPNDDVAFNYGVPLYDQSATITWVNDGGINIPQSDQDPVAWMVAVACTQSAKYKAVEFASDGPYPTLNSMGVADEQIAQLKELVSVDVGSRDVKEGAIGSFVASLGFIKA